MHRTHHVSRPAPQPMRGTPSGAQALVFQTADNLPTRLVQAFADLGSDLAPHRGTDAALNVITRRAVRAVPRADCAAISKGLLGAFTTVAATDDLALRVDDIQYQLNSGPCVDAMVKDDIFRTADLTCDSRWPEFGPRAAADTGVRSMLCVRIVLEEEGPVAAINMYSSQPDAFDDSDQLVSTLLATHSAVALTSARRGHENEGLRRALATNRDIGAAIGILMNANKLDRDQAFDLLRISSQQNNRKLVDIAHLVIETGELDLPS